MSRIILYADFNNADAGGRLRLNCQGTLDDLIAEQIDLREGLNVIVSDGVLVQRVFSAAVGFQLKAKAHRI